MVTDAYRGRCAVTAERTLPALEASHIRLYAAGGEHALPNGLLLRSDLPRLFDRGYVTVDPEGMRLVVSGRIREEFSNGRDYYALRGRPLARPDDASLHVGLPGGEDRGLPFPRPAPHLRHPPGRSRLQCDHDSRPSKSFYDPDERALHARYG